MVYLGHQTDTLPARRERYRPTRGAQLAPQLIEHRPHVIGAVSVGPYQRRELCMAQSVRGPVKCVQDLPFSARQLDVQAGRAAAPIVRSVENFAD